MNPVNVKRLLDVEDELHRRRIYASDLPPRLHSHRQARWRARNTRCVQQTEHASANYRSSTPRPLSGELAKSVHCEM